MAFKRAKQMAPMAPPRIIQRQVGQVLSLPPPVGGWNRRDPVSQMPPTDAVVLDNFIPGNGSVAVRNGYSSWATGLGSFVESLMEYSNATTNKLFAATPTAIYDVTASGAVGAAVQSTLSNGRWQHCNFAAGAGSQYIILANGADAVRNYDGTTWTQPVITGVTSTNVVNVTVHTQRVWLVENASLNIWYLPVNAISGAASSLPIGPYCKLGGYIVAAASWTQDGGAGLNDLLCIITSKGEMVIYSGTDPASNFVKVGTFRVPPPLGRRCFVQAGSDLAVLTETGLVPLSKVLSYNLSSQAQTAFTDKINGAFKEYAARGSFFGWQVMMHPAKELVIVNAPLTERNTQHQFVLNARTGAWCRFTNMNAGCWSRLADNIYFGDNSGTVWQYSTGWADNTTEISAIMQQAYTDLGVQQVKRFVSARPIVQANFGFQAEVALHLDYDTSSAPLTTTITTATGLPLWDVALWNTSFWSPGLQPSMKWQAVTGVGKAVSPILNISLNNDFQLNGMDLMFEPGGYW